MLPKGCFLVSVETSNKTLDARLGIKRSREGRGELPMSAVQGSAFFRASSSGSPGPSGRNTLPRRTAERQIAIMI